MQYDQASGDETIRVLVADDTRIHTQLLADALRRDNHWMDPWKMPSMPSGAQKKKAVIRLG